MKKINLLLATCAATLALIATPASAFASNKICETFGSHCVGAPSINLYQPVEETSGRELVIQKLSTTYGNYKEYQLEFAADTSKCVGANNAGPDVEVRQCGATGTVWFKVPEGTAGEYWGNEYVTHTLHGDKDWWVLSGINVDNAPFHVYDVGTYGQVQKFNIK